MSLTASTGQREFPDGARKGAGDKAKLGQPGHDFTVSLHAHFAFRSPSTVKYGPRVKLPAGSDSGQPGEGGSRLRGDGDSCGDPPCWGHEVTHALPLDCISSQLRSENTHFPRSPSSEMYKR